MRKPLGDNLAALEAKENRAASGKDKHEKTRGGLKNSGDAVCERHENLTAVRAENERAPPANARNCLALLGF